MEVQCTAKKIFRNEIPKENSSLVSDNNHAALLAFFRGKKILTLLLITLLAISPFIVYYYRLNQRGTNQDEPAFYEGQYNENNALTIKKGNSSTEYCNDKNQCVAYFNDNGNTMLHCVACPSCSSVVYAPEKGFTCLRNSKGDACMSIHYDVILSQHVCFDDCKTAVVYNNFGKTSCLFADQKVREKVIVPTMAGQISKVPSPETHSLASVVHPTSLLQSQTSNKVLSSMSTLPKKVLVPIADGTEEIEAVSIIDTLVRAGAEVIVASVSQLEVTCARGVRLVADCLLQDCPNVIYDVIACPGGMPGAAHLAQDKTLTELLTSQNTAGRVVAAICASPAVVLQAHGLIGDRPATCYPNPAFQGTISNYSDDSVVVSGNLVTSRGPGTALQFALKLVEVLYGQDKADQIKSQLLA